MYPKPRVFLTREEKMSLVEESCHQLASEGNEVRIHDAAEMTVQLAKEKGWINPSVATMEAFIGRLPAKMQKKLRLKSAATRGPAATKSASKPAAVDLYKLIKNLPPNKRTKRDLVELAKASGIASWKVSSYLYQNPSARKFLDGS